MSRDASAVERIMMTVQSSFKRLVRARMAKTGESYTTARARLLAGAEQAHEDQVPQLVCSDARIRERTGRGWEDWFALLDSWDAESMQHRQIVKRLREVLGDDGWSAQAVTASFERARGKRVVGERVGRDGFVATASRTVAVDAEEVFAAFVDPSRRAGWLPEVVLSERTVSKPRTARFDVADGRTRLLVVVDAKGPAKSTVVVEQSRLAGTAERETQGAFWRAALTRLKAELEQDLESRPT